MLFTKFIELPLKYALLRILLAPNGHACHRHLQVAFLQTPFAAVLWQSSGRSALSACRQNLSTTFQGSVPIPQSDMLFYTCYVLPPRMFFKRITNDSRYPLCSIVQCSMQLIPNASPMGMLIGGSFDEFLDRLDSLKQHSHMLVELP